MLRAGSVGAGIVAVAVDAVVAGIEVVVVLADGRDACVVGARVLIVAGLVIQASAADAVG